MKPKHIITLTACLFFLLANLSAMAGEKVQIRIDGLVAFIYEKGEVKQTKGEGLKKAEDYFKWRAEIVQKYFEQGYNLIAYTSIPFPNSSSVLEYILEKP